MPERGRRVGPYRVRCLADRRSMNLLHRTTGERYVRTWGVQASQPILTASGSRLVWVDRRVGTPGSIPAAVDATDTGPRLWRFVVNSVATFVVVLVVGLAALSMVPIAAGYRPISLSSGSMEPSLGVGDVVVTNPVSVVSVGSVVEFKSGGESRVHRVVELVGTSYRTKGDNNQAVDQQLVAADDIRGVGVFVVPFAGLPRLWLDQGQWLKLAITVATVGLCGALARDEWIWSSTLQIHRDRNRL